MKPSTRAALDNRSRQLNPQDVRYRESRGVPATPSSATDERSREEPKPRASEKADQ